MWVLESFADLLEDLERLFLGSVDVDKDKSFVLVDFLGEVISSNGEVFGLEDTWGSAIVVFGLFVLFVFLVLGGSRLAEVISFEVGDSFAQGVLAEENFELVDMDLVLVFDDFVFAILLADQNDDGGELGDSILFDELRVLFVDFSELKIISQTTGLPKVCL